MQGKGVGERNLAARLRGCARVMFKRQFRHPKPSFDSHLQPLVTLSGALCPRGLLDLAPVADR